MKIIIADKLGCRYPEVGYGIKQSLEEMGHKVSVFDYRLLKLQHFPISNRFVNEMLKKKASGNDLLIVGKGESILPGVIDSIRKKGITSVNWDNDEPFGKLLPFNKIDNIVEYDAFFIYDKQWIPHLKKINKHSYFLPPGADPFNLHKEVVSLNNRDYEADLCMVGTAYQNRVELLSSLDNKYKLKLAGPGWNKKDNPFKDSAKPHIPFSEMMHFYNKSKIVMNTYGDSPYFIVPNNRTFEIPSSRSFQLTNMPRDAEEFFKLNKEIVVYKDEIEFKELVDYYLDHKDKREDIAQAGYDRVIKEHTIRHRIEKMLKIIDKI